MAGFITFKMKNGKMITLKELDNEEEVLGDVALKAQELLFAVARNIHFDINKQMKEDNHAQLPFTEAIPLVIKQVMGSVIKVAYTEDGGFNVFLHAPDEERVDLLDKLAATFSPLTSFFTEEDDDTGKRDLTKLTNESKKGDFVRWTTLSGKLVTGVLLEWVSYKKDESIIARIMTEEDGVVKVDLF